MRPSPVSRAVALTLGAALTLACSSSSEPEEGTPSVVTRTLTDPPPYDASTYALYCLAGPESPSTVSETCPVIRWAGYEYWALNYSDNRSSMAIHAYDANGTLTNVVERTGARYVYAIEVDPDAETVTFRGQVDHTVTMTWQELRLLR
jgi:hypothetical protein